MKSKNILCLYGFYRDSEFKFNLKNIDEVYSFGPSLKNDKNLNEYITEKEVIQNIRNNSENEVKIEANVYDKYDISYFKDLLVENNIPINYDNVIGECKNSHTPNYRTVSMFYHIKKSLEMIDSKNDDDLIILYRNDYKLIDYDIEMIRKKLEESDVLVFRDTKIGIPDSYFIFKNKFKKYFVNAFDEMFDFYKFYYNDKSHQLKYGEKFNIPELFVKQYIDSKNLKYSFAKKILQMEKLITFTDDDKKKM